MDHASLFSGIGGFDLAASWMGWRNRFQVENDDFCCRILEHHFPETVRYGNIKETDFRPWRGTIEVVSGGFPCQPFSHAGERRGTEDDRHLWPEMCRAIREIRPTYIVGENVLGLVTWNGGMVLEEVLSDLEAEGYEAFPVVLPAASVNAPHRRERTFIIAHRNGSSEGEQRGADQGPSGKVRREEKGALFAGSGQAGHAPRAERGQDGWEGFPTEPSLCGGNDGFPERMGELAFPKWRKESLKALGNAVVPQLIHRIFKEIQRSHERNR